MEKPKNDDPSKLTEFQEADRQVIADVVWSLKVGLAILAGVPFLIFAFLFFCSAMVFLSKLILL